MDYELIQLIANVSSFSGLLPLAVLSLRGSAEDRIKQGLSWLVVCGFVTEMLALFTYRVLELSNLPLLHLYTVVELLLILLIFSRMGVIGERMRRALTIAFALLAIYAAWRWHGIYEMNVIPRSLGSLLVIGLTGSYFYQQFRSTDLYSVDAAPAGFPAFWIAVAWFLYFPPSLFIFLYGDWFILEEHLSLQIYVAHAILTIVKSILYAIALWVKTPQPVSGTSLS